MPVLPEARGVAADYLELRGLAAAARTVRAGGGDDFPEVEIAVLAQRALMARIDRYQRALGNYADDSFWDGEIEEATLAFHDRGEIARAALAGRDGFDLHRD